MIANSAFLAAMVLALLVFSLMDQLAFLAPYKRLILQQYLWVIVWSLVAVFVNLFAFFYAVNRRLFLKDTGRKLAHVEKQLLTPDTIVRDLSDRLAQDD
jgi:presenilin-like A22 family membrane protease